MGFFSWITQDTNRSICNKHQEVKPTFTVYMVDDKGNIWKEWDYDGYGVFGGKDYYVLLAEMNGIPQDRPESLMRNWGIDMAFSGREDLKFPNLVEDPDNWNYTSGEPDRCPDQGYFYGEDDDDEYGYEDEEE